MNSNLELHLTIKDSDNSQWEIPQKEPYPIDKNHSNYENSVYRIEISTSDFNFKIIRKESNEEIFNTNLGKFIISEKYTTFTTSLPSSDVFGIGERFDYLKLKPNAYRVWVEDNGANGSGKEQTTNTYGAQPLYLVRESKSTKFDIIFLRSSSSLQVTLLPEDSQGNLNRLKFEFVGGIIDLKFFFGDESPETVIKNYHEYIGGFSVPPFWSLGNHQCRWGYKNSSEVEKVVESFVNNDIPLDTFWLDIDYMRSKFCFSVNEEDFSSLSMKNLKMKYKKKFVVITDPTIAAYPFYHNTNESYMPLLKGLEQNVFLKDYAFNDYPYLSKQWAGPVYIVDFSHPNASSYWENSIRDFKAIYDIDGLWLDMNEVSAFSNGRYNLSDEYAQNSHGLPYPDDSNCAYQKENYPFLPGNQCLFEKTIDTEIVHYDGTKELYLHNLFNLDETKVTYDSLKKILNTR